MSIRPKTVKRIIILLVVTLIVGAGGAGMYAYNQNQRQERLKQNRTEGLAAAEAKDWPIAGEKLQPVVRAYPSDLQVAYALARARLFGDGEASNPNQAMSLLQEIVRNSPTDSSTEDPADTQIREDARKLLLELYVAAGINPAARKLADEILADNPDDIDALTALATALAGNDNNRALAASLRLNELEPDNLDGHIRTMSLLRRQGRPGSVVLEFATGKLAERPDDPRRHLLVAIAADFAGDRELSTKHLDAAVAAEPPDEAFTLRLVDIFDRMNRFEQADQLLVRMLAADAPPTIRYAMAARQWQLGSATAALQTLQDVPPDTISPLVGLKAALLLHRGDRRGAYELLDVLDARDDRTSLAWSRAVKAAFDTPDATADSLEAMRLALDVEPDNSFFRAWLGDAYGRLGENELAMRHWREAAQAAPAWAAPKMAISRALLAAGRTNTAIAEAGDAFRRSRGSDAALINLLSIRAARLAEAPTSSETEVLLEQIEALQARRFGEPETLPVYVALTERTRGPDAARQIIERALELEPPLPVATRVRLAEVSSQHELGLEDRLLAGVPMTPAIAFDRARSLAMAGRMEQARKLLQRPGKSWELAEARLLEVAGHAEAPAYWARLAEKYADDPDVQRMLLDAPSLAREYDVLSRAVDRLRDLTGEAGQRWKIERAKLLLETSGDDHARSMEAINILEQILRETPVLVEPRIYLALGLEKKGQVASATQHLRRAAEHDPGNARATLELARLLKSRGMIDESRVYLRRLKQEGVRGPAFRNRLAAYLVEAGEPVAAIELLQDADLVAGLDPDGRRFLAQLLWRRGETTAAAGHFERLLEDASPTRESVVSAASFYHATGRPQEAEQTIALLEADRFGTGERLWGQAAYAENRGDLGTARQLLEQATASPGATAEMWISRVRLEQQARDYERARQLADEAVSRFAEHETLRNVALEARAIDLAGGGASRLDDLIAVFAADPAKAEWAQLLRSLQAEMRSRKTSGEDISMLQDLAQRLPTFFPLQAILIEAHWQRGELQAAAAAANAAFAALPNDPEAARYATYAFQLASMWPEAENAARAWRRTALVNPLEPNTFIAEASLEQGRAANAVSILEPHADALRANPNALAKSVTVLAAAYTANGQQPEAMALLKPLAEKSPRWQAAWVRTAVQRSRDGSAALAWMRDLKPETPEGRRMLAIGCLQLFERFGEPRLLDEALSMLEPALSAPTPEAADLRLAGQIALRQADLAAAIAFYERLLAVKPDDAPALNDLAYALLTQQTELERARDLASRAVAIDPQPAYRDTLGRVLLSLEALPEAIEQFKAALETDPDRVEALLGLAAALRESGQEEDAREALFRAERAARSQQWVSPTLREQMDGLRADLNN